MTTKGKRTTYDPDIIRFLCRVEMRSRRHPNWRQVFLDCQGQCQYDVGESVICGETESLEFHEVFGEAKNGEGKFQQRVLLCNYHHWSVHGEKWVNMRHFPSKLQTDVNLEIMLVGGLAEWIAKYNLIERRIDYDIETNSKADKTDLNNGENS